MVLSILLIILMGLIISVIIDLKHTSVNAGTPESTKQSEPINLEDFDNYWAYDDHINRKLKEGAHITLKFSDIAKGWTDFNEKS